MKSNPSRSGKDWVWLLGKFASASVIATLIDFCLFFVLVKFYLPDQAQIATVISRSVGMLVNFYLHKQYVFDLKRGLGSAFVLSMLISLGGLALAFIFMSWAGNLSYFAADAKMKLIPKVLEAGLIFFYNFFLKKFAFEKSFK